MSEMLGLPSFCISLPARTLYSATRNAPSDAWSVKLFPATETGLYMHEKILLTDNTALIIGSQNLTTTSLLENRELSLALDTATAPDLIATVEINLRR